MEKENTKECANCKRQIPGDAKVCPYCEKKQPLRKEDIIVYILIGIIVLGVLGLLFFNNTGIGRNDEIAHIPENETLIEDSQEIEPAPETNTEQAASANQFALGQTYSDDNVDVTLNYAGLWNGDEYYHPESGKTYLLLNLTIKNNKQEEYSVFDTQFTGYVDNVNTNEDFVSEDSLDYDYLLPGTMETGNISFQVPDNWDSFQLRVKTNYDSNNVGVFTVKRDQARNITTQETNNSNNHHEEDEHDEHDNSHSLDSILDE